jgi:taurine dioxygenase
MQLRPLHEALGIEVIDFDVLAPATPDEVAELRRAYDEHHLLVFRDGPRIPPERQVEMTAWFGPPPPVDNTGRGQLWTVLSNENDAGRLQLPFHSDFTYTDAPIKGISLHALELPAGGTTTSFVSGVWGWATLPHERQEMLDGLTVRHTYDSRIGDALPTFTAVHPLCLRHPRTGTPILFVTEHHAVRVEELEPAESDRVLQELFAHLYARDNVYVHEWRLHDFVVWDNLVAQHAREVQAETVDGPRALQRVALNDVTYDELIARATEQQRLRELQGV